MGSVCCLMRCTEKKREQPIPGRWKSRTVGLASSDPSMSHVRRWGAVVVHVRTIRIGKYKRGALLGVKEGKVQQVRNLLTGG